LATAGCGDGASGTSSTSPPAAVTEAGAAATTAAPPSRFAVDGFDVAGSLHLPARDGPVPAVILVHGSGPQTRTSTPTALLVQRLFLDRAFAVLVWDKPGSGASTGEFDTESEISQRAGILVAGIDLLRDRPDVDADRIGLWGLSQAGWVMPMALEQTDVAFMISVSGGGEDSIEQLTYSLSRQLLCDGLDEEQADLVAAYGAQAIKGPAYADYVAAMEVLLEIPGTDRFIGPGIDAEDEWAPWPADIDAWFNPMEVVAKTTIPVLAIYGQEDKNVDPVQGAEAYGQALQDAGNPWFHVELIPGVGHTMQQQETGCPGDRGGVVSERYVELLEEWIGGLEGEI
jgi:pimeloyl-ACP methyl ester carboxylesterase